MLRNQYTPSIFSRVVWLLIAINSFAGIIFSHGSTASVLLGGIALLGSAIICLISFWKGTRTMGQLEYICLALLFLSIVIWVLFRTPLLNLLISLCAHFIGALPTYKKVWLQPRSESTGFWSLFFLASLLSVFVSGTNSLQAIIYPIYYTFFDGGMFLLTLRKHTQK